MYESYESFSDTDRLLHVRGKPLPPSIKSNSEVFWVYGSGFRVVVKDLRVSPRSYAGLLSYNAS